MAECPVVGEQILDFFERRSERAKMWSITAERKGGVYVPPRGGLFRRTKPEIHAEVHGVAVFVTLRTEGSGDSRETFTIVRAPWLLGTGPELQVLRAGMFRKMGRALGMQDVPTGDPQFDSDFIVKSPTPILVPVVLGPRPRRTLRALGRPRIDCSISEAKLTLGGVVTEVARMSLAMDAIAEIASHGTAHVNVLSRLPGTFVAPQGPFTSRAVPHTVLELGRARVHAIAISHPRGIYYALRADLQRDVPDLVLRFIDGAPDPKPPEGLFDPETFGTLISLGNLTLRTGRGTAQLELSGDLDADALTRAARWLSQFVEGRRQGAFR